MSKSLKKLIDINRLREFKNKLVGAGSPYVQTAAVDQTIDGTKTFSKPIVGSVTGSSGSCTGNSATATKAVSADSATNASHATSADRASAANCVQSQSSDPHVIIFDWSSQVPGYVGLRVDATDMGGIVTTNRLVEVYNLLNGKANTSGTYSDLTVGNAGSATNATYANWLRTSSHSDHLFHTEWDGAGYFWTYVTTGSGEYRAVRVARSDSSGNADTATTATTAEACTGNAATATTATNSNAANQLQAFVNDDFTDGNHYVKAIRSSQGWSTHLWMCYNNGAKMADEVSVNYANSAGSANTANSATRATNADHATNADSATRATNADSAANADHATNADSATRATSADRASAADHVQSQTSAYHEISFDWSSQVPGYVGLRVDETDMGGIVTTNRLVSDIHAQWYAAYPDGAEAHNAMWGGRDITAAFDAGTVSANIANGTFKDIFPGDYITKQVTISGTAYTVNWVVADCDYWINKGDTATTVHHVVIVPQAPIFDAQMNATNTTEGGYMGSRMFKETIPACATGIVNAFGSDHILTFRDGISNSVDASVSSGIPQWTGTPGWWGEWVSVQCNLMSEKMVYGAPICSAGAMDNSVATRQMSAFRLSEKLINYNHQWWWLRDVVSSAFFALVGGTGRALASHASIVSGVRPFALLV